MRATSDWLGTWARFRPDAEAIYDVGTGRRYTYVTLQREANAWARRLHREGVAPGDRVAVLAFNRAETLALLFACADLGAILFPVNWRLSPAEIDYQLSDCAPHIVLVDAAHRDLLPDALDLDAGPREEGDTGEVGPGSRLEDPWMIMYTSGSTGRPKGALLTHGQLHWNALNTILACDLTPQCSTLTFTPLFHTGGMNCLTTPLLHRGGRVVLTPGLDAGQALRLIAEERVTHLMGVPTIYRMLADHPDFPNTDLSSVRDALCGGAPLPLPLLEEYLDRGLPLRQGFGLTEVGPNCFSTPPHEVRRKLGCVGLPIHHVGVKLVRPDGSACDIDEPGELLLGGPAVFGGYWGQLEETAKSLKDGWFHTGDVLSRDAEGFYRVAGRIKEMFISGGENVYPAEVEGVLATCPGVALAAVVGVPDARWGEVGAAFLEPSPGAELRAETVRAWLDGKLARYKIPKIYVFDPALPRTASGKIDKPALRARAVARTQQPS